MSGLKSSLSRESYDFLVSSEDFFKSVTALYGQHKLGLQLSSGENQTETRHLANGDLSLSFVYTLDDNYRPEDGRLYLKDTFIFDPNGEIFKKFNRDFEFNGRGSQGGKWQGLLEKYRKAALPNDDQVKSFAKKIAGTYSRPLYANQKFWDILKTNDSVRTFFGQAGALVQRVQPAYSIKSLDPQSGYTLVSKGDHVEIVLNLVLDSDPEPRNGRLFLQDRFEIDPKTGVLKNYSRKYLPPRKIIANRDLPKPQAEVLRTLEGLNGLPAPSLAQAQTFLKAMWAAFQNKDLDLSEWNFEQALKGNKDFFRTFGKLDAQGKGFLVNTGLSAQKLREDWVLRGSDEDSRIRIRSLGNRVEIQMTTVLAKYKESDKNRVYCHDRFILSKKDYSLKGYSRYFEPLPDTFEDETYREQVVGLNQSAIPSKEAARQFIAAMAPAIFPASVKRTEGQLDELKKDGPVEIPENYIPLPLRGEKVFISQEQRQETYQLLKVIALEKTHQNVSASKGWLNLGGKKNLTTEVGVVESLFGKIQDKLLKDPQADPLGILEDMELSGSEAKLRKRLIKDPLILEINHIGQETDPQIRDRELMVLARENLFKRKKLFGTALATAELLKTRPYENEPAGELSAFLKGGGSVATKFELMGSTFVNHVFDRNMILAMMGGGLAGGWIELKGLHLFGRMGGIGRAGSQVLGLAGEAAAFTTLHKVGQSLDQDPAQIWKGWGEETLSAGMLFGAMRLGHWGTGGLSKLMGLGGTGWRAGWAGSALQKTLHVGAGVEAMYLAGVIGRWWGLQQPNGQGQGHHQFDALVMYTQAMLGFGIANGMTGNALKTKITELKFNSKIYQESLKQVPGPFPKTPAWARELPKEADSSVDVETPSEPQVEKPVEPPPEPPSEKISDPTPLPPPIPFDSGEPTPTETPQMPSPPGRIPLGTPLPRAQTEGRLPLPPDPEPEIPTDVILLDESNRKKIPPLPPPLLPEKDSTPLEKNKKASGPSDGVPVDPWAEEPTAPHGKTLVSETVAKETIPKVITEIIRKGVTGYLKKQPKSETEIRLGLKLNIREILRKAELFPENEIPPDYKDEAIQIGLKVSPDSRQLTLSSKARNALRVRKGNETDPAMRAIYEALLKVDGMALKPRGKRAGRESARHRAPTARPWPGHPALPEVLEYNDQALRDRQMKLSPSRFDWVKEIAIHRSRYLEGVLTMDAEGQVDVSRLFTPNFDSSERIWDQQLVPVDLAMVPVIVSKGTILWHGPLPGKMNSLQRAAFQYLKEGFEEVMAEDPYAVDALLHQRLGPLALDLGDLLTEQPLREGEGAHQFEILLFNESGVLRAYEKESAKPVPNTQSVGKISWNLKVTTEEGPRLESFDYTMDPRTPRAQEITVLLDYLENRFKNRRILVGENRSGLGLKKNIKETSASPREDNRDIKDSETDFSDLESTQDIEPLSIWEGVSRNQEFLSGERLLEESPRLQRKYEGVGEFAGVTDEGIGSKEHNEDTIGLAEGRGIHLLVFDGAGGHKGGKEASHSAALTMIEGIKEGLPLSETAQIASENLLANFPDAKTTVVAARIIPPAEPSHPSRLQFLWAGDSKGMLLRRDSEGKWQWVYRTKEDSYTRQLVDAEIEDEGKNLAEGGIASRRTQEIVTHPFNNRVSNILGIKETILHDISDGEFYDPQMGTRNAEGVISIDLKQGDMILLASDGLFDNFTRTRSLLDIIERVDSPQEMVDILHWETRYRMQVLAWAVQAHSDGSLPEGHRFVFEYQGAEPQFIGKNLYVELVPETGSGKIYDSPEGGRLVGHYKPDNISIGVYRHEGKSGSEGPPELPPPPTNLVPSSREGQRTPVEIPKKKTLKK